MPHFRWRPLEDRGPAHLPAWLARAKPPRRPLPGEAAWPKTCGASLLAQADRDRERRKRNKVIRLARITRATRVELLANHDRRQLCWVELWVANHATTGTKGVALGAVASEVVSSCDGELFVGAQPQPRAAGHFAARRDQPSEHWVESHLGRAETVVLRERMGRGELGHQADDGRVEQSCQWGSFSTDSTSSRPRHDAGPTLEA